MLMSPVVHKTFHSAKTCYLYRSTRRAVVQYYKFLFRFWRKVHSLLLVSTAEFTRHFFGSDAGVMDGSKVGSRSLTQVQSEFV